MREESCWLTGWLENIHIWAVLKKKENEPEKLGKARGKVKYSIFHRGGKHNSVWKGIKGSNKIVLRNLCTEEERGRNDGVHKAGKVEKDRGRRTFLSAYGINSSIMPYTIEPIGKKV